MQVIPYDREAAIEYARRWALSRNPAYYNFEKIGGDCTNFASQCIYAGARVMNYTPVSGWYYNSLSSRAPAWTSVQYLYNFLIGNKAQGPYARVVSRQEAEPGDIVQLGKSDGVFYHSPVITATHPIILVAAHTYDALDRPLDTYIYDQARFIHIEGARK